MELNKEEFLKIYPIEEYFDESKLEWETLEKIYKNFCDKDEYYNIIASELQNELINALKKTNVAYQSCFFRVKNPEHLVEKIIRKLGKEHNYKYNEIDENNYQNIVHDFVGGRVLLLYKEQWKSVFDCINQLILDKASLFSFAEDPVAYAKYGDRDLYENVIHKEHTNKGYRSQHYILCYKGVYCEIQVRTLAEEVYGEFDHFVKYPYREGNNFLRRYTKSLSDLLDSVDEIMSTCMTIGEEGWEYNSTLFDKDKFIDWKNLSQYRGNLEDSSDLYELHNVSDKVSMLDYSQMVYSKRRKEEQNENAG